MAITGQYSVISLGILIGALEKMPPRKNASWKKCLLERMPPEYFVTRKKCLLRIKLFQLLKMLYFKYIQSKLQHTISKSIITLQVHITVANACQKFTVFFLICLALQLGKWAKRLKYPCTARQMGKKTVNF